MGDKVSAIRVEDAKGLDGKLDLKLPVTATSAPASLKRTSSRLM